MPLTASARKNAAAAGPPAGPGFDGTFDLFDGKLSQLSAKQRKHVVRSRSILLQVNGVYSMMAQRSILLSLRENHFTNKIFLT